jgi:hypothetical protein
VGMRSFPSRGSLLCHTSHAHEAERQPQSEQVHDYRHPRDGHYAYLRESAAKLNKGTLTRD